MFESHNLLNLACDLAFFATWATLFRRVVPKGGFRRFAGVTGWLLTLAGYVLISTRIFTRWSASYLFDNVWSMPLDALDKVGVLTVVCGVMLIVLANLGIQHLAVRKN